MKKTKKILALALCAVMLVCISVGATVAYLTAGTGVVTNTFTVGNVAITLDEAKADEYGVEVSPEQRVNANAYKLIPNHEYAKDPTVHVTVKSEPCYVFVKVVNGITAIEAEGATTIAAQMAANGWNQLKVTADDGTEQNVENVFYYQTTVDAREEAKDLVVFETFKIATGADVAQYASASITIDAYAVQADGFDSAADAWKAAPTDWN